MRKEEKHNQEVKRISNNPKLLGLEGIVLSVKEMTIFKWQGEYGERYREPDLLFFDPYQQIIYNIEYKTSSNHKEKAILQLREVNGVLRGFFPEWEVINLYVHGRKSFSKYKKEVIPQEDEEWCER